MDKNKRNTLIVLFDLLGVVFLLFAMTGEKYVEYAASIGWIGAAISLTIALGMMAKIIFKQKDNR